jgi:hypothetical protein
LHTFNALSSGIHRKELNKIKDESGKDVRDIISLQFNRILDILAKNVTKRVLSEIKVLPLGERLKRFSSLPKSRPLGVF